MRTDQGFFSATQLSLSTALNHCFSIDPLGSTFSDSGFLQPSDPCKAIKMGREGIYEAMGRTQQIYIIAKEISKIRMYMRYTIDTIRTEKYRRRMDNWGYKPILKDSFSGPSYVIHEQRRTKTQ